MSAAAVGGTGKRGVCERVTKPSRCVLWWFAVQSDAAVSRGVGEMLGVGGSRSAFALVV